MPAFHKTIKISFVVEFVSVITLEFYDSEMLFHHTKDVRREDSFPFPRYRRAAFILYPPLDTDCQQDGPHLT
jgi:hypothetical protein